MGELLPDFPVDDATLLALEHAMGTCLTLDRPEGVSENEEGPWRIQGDYGMYELLDFLAGCTGRDPNEVLLQPARDESDLPEWERGRNWANSEITYDTRIHYTEHSVIKALIAEVRRLRNEGASDAHAEAIFQEPP